jgi:serine/threonine-protein kinase
VAGLIALLAVTGYVVATRPWKAAAAPPSMLVAIDTGFDGSIVPDLLPEMAFSPDGSTLALAGRSRQRGRSHIYLRRFDQLGAKMLEGTEDASFPFFSPDGQWVGFFVANRLCKVSVNGGAAVPLADVQIPRGATWGDDDVITFAPVAVPGGVLMRVPASGGTPAPFGPMLKGHVTQRFPQAVRGSRVLLYTGATNVDSFEDSCLMAQEPGAEPKVVQCGGYAWRYLPEGYVTYVHNGSLFAAPFDLASLKLTGPPHPVVPLVRGMPGSGGAQYAISPAGVLAYIPGDTEGERRQLQIFDRSGHGTPLEGIPAGWQSMTLSPDGKQLALGVLGANAGVWVYDFARAAATRLTLGAGDQNPIWTPDGRRITYGAAQNGPPNLWWVAADGSGRPERLLQADSLEVPEAWSPDGSTLLFSYGARGKFDIWATAVGGNPPKAGAPRPFIATPANDGSSSFSPDGKWVAYTSDESGAYQIYVRAASGTGARYQISVTDGVWATWSRVRPEMLLGGLDGQIASVTWSAAGGVFHASRPEPWTPARYDVRGTFAPFVLLPDGNRVLMAQQQAGAPADKLVLVTSFVNDLQGQK